MTQNPEKDDKTVSVAFEEAGSIQAGGNIVSELWYFVSKNRKWWLLPILGALMLLGALVLLSGSAAAPFIYTLF